MPERHGPWKDAHDRLRRWAADGARDRILDVIVVEDDEVGNVEWVLSIDSSSVRAHQRAAGARDRGSQCGWVEALAVDGERLGRWRGGLTSNIHLVVDGRG